MILKAMCCDDNGDETEQVLGTFQRIELANRQLFGVTAEGDYIDLGYMNRHGAFGGGLLEDATRVGDGPGRWTLEEGMEEDST